jgi:hypothetical protein
MDLLLHIGTEKTGTKTIQRFLAANRAALAGQGLCVPQTLGDPNHRRLPAMACDDGYVDDYVRRLNLQDGVARRAAKDLWRASFTAEIARAAAAPQPARRVIISSEHLQSRLSRPGEIERLHALLAPLFDRITVLVYLRDPLETAVSLYSTAVKNGEDQPGPRPPDHPYYHNVVNHARTLQRWGAVFGQAALHPRLFGPAEFQGGGLLADFAVAACLPDAPPGAPYILPGPQNEALSALGTELLRRVNRRLPLFGPEGRLNPARGRIIDHFQRHFGSGPRFVPDPALAAAYAGAFAASDAWVRATWFPGRAALFPPAGAAAGPPPVLPDPADIDRLADLLTGLWTRAE